MSRWQAEFDQHAFRASWQALQTEVPLLQVDDQTVQTSLDEVARLNKVIAYLSWLIDSVDVELTPKTVWDNFQQQSELCLGQVRSYSSNRNIGHITNANLNADNLLSYVKPYMVLPKDTVAALAAATKAYQSQVQEFLSTALNDSSGLVAAARTNAATIETLSVSIKAIVEPINALKIELIDGTPEKESTAKKIENLSFAVAKESATVKAYHDELLLSGTTPSIRAVIDASAGDIAKVKVKIEGLLTDAEQKISALKDFNTKIFGKPTDDDEEVGGLAGELNTRTLELKRIEDEQKSTYSALFTKIEGLLPGATSLGLASAYKDLKESFDKKISTNNRIFYAAVVALLVISFLSSIEIDFSPFSLSFVVVTTFEEILRFSLLKLPFILPVVWLAIFASMRRSQYERLQQEYAHKEALAKSYYSYKTELDKLQIADVETLKKDLIAKAIDAIAFNASTTLNGKHIEKMPMEHAFELVGGDKVLGALEKVKGLFK